MEEGVPLGTQARGRSRGPNSAHLSSRQSGCRPQGSGLSLGLRSHPGAPRGPTFNVEVEVKERRALRGFLSPGGLSTRSTPHSDQCGPARVPVNPQFTHKLQRRSPTMSPAWRCRTVLHPEMDLTSLS